MKKLLYLHTFSLVLLLIDTSVQAQWRKIELRQHMTVFNNITDVFFVGEDTGFIATVPGILYRTIDGGNSWTFDTLTPQGSIQRIFFPTSQTGYLTTGDNRILKTTDGGNNWTDISNGLLFGQSQAVYFFDADTGLVCGIEGTIFKTTDGGANWSYSRPYLIDLVVDVNFISRNVGYMIGNCFWGGDDRASIWRTYDGGNTWQESKCPQGLLWKYTHANLLDSTAQIGYYWPIRKLGRSNIDGSAMTFLYPQNAVADDPDLNVPASMSRNIQFYEGRTGMVGHSNAITVTEDSGYTWRMTDIADTINYISYCGNRSIRGFYPITEDKWIAYGNCGRLYITENKGGVWSGINETENETTFALTPNPANNYLTITTSEQTTPTKLTVTDVNGRVIIEQQLHTPTTQLPIANLQAGLYFVAIQNEKGRVVRRFVKE